MESLAAAVSTIDAFRDKQVGTKQASKKDKMGVVFNPSIIMFSIPEWLLVD